MRLKGFVGFTHIKGREALVSFLSVDKQVVREDLISLWIKTHKSDRLSLVWNLFPSSSRPKTRFISQLIHSMRCDFPFSFLSFSRVCFHLFHPFSQRVISLRLSVSSIYRSYRFFLPDSHISRTTASLSSLPTDDLPLIKLLSAFSLYFSLLLQARPHPVQGWFVLITPLSLLFHRVRGMKEDRTTWRGWMYRHTEKGKESLKGTPPFLYHACVSLSSLVLYLQSESSRELGRGHRSPSLLDCTLNPLESSFAWEYRSQWVLSVYMWQPKR